MITDIPFESGRDVESIKYRLAPLDVGFDLRVQGVAVEIDPADDPIRVSYSTAQGIAGERRIAEGPRVEVLKRLRQAGYKFRSRPHVSE